MKYPWTTEKVCSCAKHVFIIIVLPNIGSILISIFTSSTCVTVQPLSGWLGIAALSKNLVSVDLILVQGAQYSAMLSNSYYEYVSAVYLNWLVCASFSSEVSLSLSSIW